MAALDGAAKHARAHAAMGVDLVIAQGTEAGGHTGDVSTLVLVPQVVDAGGIATGRQMAAPLPLPLPMPSMLSDRPPRRVEAVAERPGSPAVDLLSPFIGQVAGQMNAVRPARQVILDMVEELVDAWMVVEKFLAD